MLRSRGLIGFALTLIALCSGFYLLTRTLTNKTLSPRTVARFNPAVPPGQMTLSTVHIQGFSGGKKAWEIVSPTVKTTQQQDETTFSGDVEARLFTNDTPRALLKTTQAIYREQIHLFTAPGLVSVHLFPRNSKGTDIIPLTTDMQIETSNLQWDTEKKLLQCPQKTEVKLSQGEFSLDNTQIHLETHAVDGDNFRGRFLITKLLPKSKKHKE